MGNTSTDYALMPEKTSPFCMYFWNASINIKVGRIAIMFKAIPWLARNPPDCIL